jgi:hypothetical protein
MTRKYDEVEIQKFAYEMMKDYDKDNLIKEFCIIKDFDEEDAEFVQVGQRVNLPKEFFTKKEGVHTDNTMIASDFIRSIVNGEKEFILNEIVNSKDILQTIKLPKFSSTELEIATSKLNGATDIFFPIEKFHNKVYSLVYETPSILKFQSGKKPTILLNGRELSINWILDKEFDKIIVTNKQQVKILQKKFEQAKGVKDFSHLSKDQKLMIYLAEKKNDIPNFDFIFRTILSKPLLNANSALIIEVDN